MVSKSTEVVPVGSSPTTSKPQHSVRFYSTKTFRIMSMITLTCSFFIIELVVGNITKSLALIADAFHMLSDLIALAIGLLVVRIAKRHSNINTYGWVRAEVVGANINTVFLLTLCLTIVFDTIKRYIEPEPIENPTLLLIVGSVGLGINIIGLFLFQGYHGHSHGDGTHGHNHDEQSHGHSHDTINKSKSAHRANTTIESKDDTRTRTHTNDIEPLEIIIGSSEFKRHSLRALDEVVVDCATHAHDSSQSQNDPSPSSDMVDSSNTKKSQQKKASSMNMHGVFLHVLADALGSVVVIISALIIKFVPHDPNNKKHWTVYVDPTLSVIIIIIITCSAIPLLKESTYVLLQTVPKNIEVSSIKKKLLEQVPEIENIHELHIWRLTSNAIIATAHLRRRSLTDYMTVADKVRNFFHGVGIHSTTIQYEQQGDESEDYLIDNEKENGKGNSSQTDCLLSCPEEACSAKTCCTKESIRTNAALNVTNNDIIHEKKAGAIETGVESENDISHVIGVNRMPNVHPSEQHPLLKSD